MSLNVKKGDNVKIIAGKDKGKSGKITAVSVAKQRVIVEDCNIITKHIKARSAQSQSSIQKGAGSIDVSNVQIICPTCNQPTRVGNTVIDGKKNRTCKKCNASLDIKVADKKVKKARKAEAKDADGATKKKTTAKKTTAKKTTAKSDKE